MHKLPPSKLFLIVSFLVLTACRPDSRRAPLFEALPSSQTGIDFNNVIREDNRLNIITFEYLYNGAGVGVIDVNNDGLSDLLFTANMSDNRLYLNKGNFQFEDITEHSGLLQRGKWASGVSVVDINQDGLQDIYICYAGPYTDPQKRANELYINKGNNAFQESADQYGLADTGHSVQAAFFDYDRDGDPDMYLLTNITDQTGPNIIRPKRLNGEMANTDRLYRNNGNGTFTNVSREAGILAEGYGLGVSICDVNDDGWDDVYVTNDYLSNDLLFINQQDGTFKDESASYFDHTSYSAMGNDVADFNNDGLVDFVAVDMLPPDNKRQKLMFGATNYDRYQSEIRMGYAPQYMRNTLQLNRGAIDGKTYFSEIGQFAGVAATDWSWSPLFADVDNDGQRDLLVTNGYPRDITNRDFASYKASELIHEGFSQGMSDKFMEAVSKLDGAHLPPFAFHNNGDLTFADSSSHWGFITPSYATGAAVADLDNDGDLDYVTNNLNGPASVFRNHTTERPGSHYVRISLEGPAGNREAYGTKIRIRTPSHSMIAEHRVVRGYQSSLEPFIHFGVSRDTVVNEIEVIWPNQTRQTIHNVPVDKLMKIKFGNGGADQLPNSRLDVKASTGRFMTSLHEPAIQFKHEEAPYADFKVQPLIPQQYSTPGPALAVADVNGDHLEDLLVSGSYNHSGQVFIQQKNGTFKGQPIAHGKKFEEDTGTLFFDVDGDNDQDLYVVSGGNEFAEGSIYYQDRLYLNDGQGHFSLKPNSIPTESASGSCVVGNDFDGDGDIDLFIGGRLKPQSYPDAGTSFILRNDGGQFTNITNDVAPGLQHIGMVSSALWTDFDNDGARDLIVVGEWMPITLLRNTNGKFQNVTATYGLAKSAGWWNSIAGSDVDNDGDIDYVVGNLGYNSRYKATPDHPLHAYASDFNDDGKREAILTQNIQGKEYPAHPRDDLFLQLPSYKKYYNSYAAYAEESKEAFLKRNTKNKVDTLTAHVMATCILMNQGSDPWQLKPLPAEAQFSPVYGMLIKDVDGNGSDDLVLTGNSSSPDVLTGKYDASKGLVLVGDGHGNFASQTISQSGLVVRGDARSLVLLTRGNDQLVIAGVNNDSIQLRSVARLPAHFEFRGDDAYAEIQFKNGRLRRVENYMGGGYLSQSTRGVDVPADGIRITVFDCQGKSRELALR
ncbi:VCBS repeat-containing protein [Chryseolinea sp. T2]|uniref:VCBS repeat-containing protein n=1 Tax=Chryseolinea sp. T2 TaxID=3129255 RepID=UPI003077DB06